MPEKKHTNRIKTEFKTRLTPLNTREKKSLHFVVYNVNISKHSLKYKQEKYTNIQR